jgi:hypothetical protein
MSSDSLLFLQTMATGKARLSAMHHTYTLMSSLKTLGIKKLFAHLGRPVKVAYVDFAMKAKATLSWPISNVMAQ